MRIVISCIGKMKKESSEFQIILRYLKQCQWSVTIQEFEEKRKLSAQELKKAESALLETSLTNNSIAVVLDEKGKELTSRELAHQFSLWQNAGVQNIIFCIGGANGHTESLKRKATLLLSLGKITMPHMLIRIVLAEQIFRSSCIIKGHPYHRD